MTGSEPIMHLASAAVAGPGVLVVHEGVRRLRWHHPVPDRWSLVGLWPDQAELDRVLDRVQLGEPVLLVLPAETPTVDVHEHEIQMELDSLAVVDSQAGIVELTVPLLNWLPEPLRTRGLLFADQAAAALASAPNALQPPLLVEQLDQDCAVRFARRTRASLTDHAIAAAARHLFTKQVGGPDSHPRAIRHPEQPGCSAAGPAG